METFLLTHDIKVLYVKADHFPEGIMAAHEKLHSLLSSNNRIFFGISAPDRTGEIIYKAAAEEIIKGEAEKLNLDSFVIKKGNYYAITLLDFVKEPTAIRNAFQKLIHLPGIDPLGECIEWYLNQKDVRCMVRMQSDK
jgi:hypothetical protein